MSEAETLLVVAAAVREGFEGPIKEWRIVGNRVEMWDFHGRHLETYLQERPIVLEMEPSEYDFIMPEPEPKRKPARKKGK